MNSPEFVKVQLKAVASKRLEEEIKQELLEEDPKKESSKGSIKDIIN